ncbi:MAG: hypothetical protein LKG31_02735 [Lactobacillus sp.]|nr:hypothetical protein [Lactobacillus sp.]
MSSLGLPVPGQEIAITLPKRVLTHFISPQAVNNAGQLMNELTRLHQIYQQTDKDSIVLINEIFTSTTFDDALLLTKKMMTWLKQKGSLAFIVSFIDELSSLPGVLSLVSQLKANHERSFKMVERSADGNADAVFLLSQYELTSKQIERRVDNEK